MYTRPNLSSFITEYIFENQSLVSLRSIHTACSIHTFQPMRMYVFQPVQKDVFCDSSTSKTNSCFVEIINVCAEETALAPKKRCLQLSGAFGALNISRTAQALLTRL